MQRSAATKSFEMFQIAMSAEVSYPRFFRSTFKQEKHDYKHSVIQTSEKQL